MHHAVRDLVRRFIN